MEGIVVYEGGFRRYMRRLLVKLAFKHVQPLRGGLNGLMAPAAVIREESGKDGHGRGGKGTYWLAVLLEELVVFHVLHFTPSSRCLQAIKDPK